MKKRRSFEVGHSRKFLLIVDESQEVEAALYYAASRIGHSSGMIAMLYVIEPQEFQHWMGVGQVHAAPGMQEVRQRLDGDHQVERAIGVGQLVGQADTRPDRQRLGQRRRQLPGADHRGPGHAHPRRDQGARLIGLACGIPPGQTRARDSTFDRLFPIC